MGKQVRSENTYQKIDTIFKRDVNNCIMPYHGLVSPELEWLRGCKFDAEEKIDGTNIRIEVSHKVCIDSEKDIMYIRWEVAYKGKTDKAEIPKLLNSYLRETFTEDKVLSALGLKKVMYVAEKDIETGVNMVHPDIKEHGWVDDEDPENTVDLTKVPELITLYGEGYGKGIQSGDYYRSDNALIGFDVKVDQTYLLREERDKVFQKLGCDIVPYIGQFTIDEAIEFVRQGFNSKIAAEEHAAEGLVLRSPCGIKNQAGERIIFKVKTRDFLQRYKFYQTDGPCEQEENTKYDRSMISKKNKKKTKKY